MWLDRLINRRQDRLQVLAIIPDTIDREILQGIAARAHWDVRIEGDCSSASEWLKEHVASVVICDREQKGGLWREALSTFSGLIPVVVTAPDVDDQFWLEVIERGGYDVVTRPFHESRLVVTVLRAACQKLTASS